MSVRRIATMVLAASIFAPSMALADAGASDCSRLSRKVTAALAANSGSPNYHAAQIEAGNGRTLCSVNEYDRGVVHYQKALELLDRR